MKFGLSFVNSGPLTTPVLARAFLQQVEQRGFESVWTGEHIAIPAGFASDNPGSTSGALGFPEDFPIADPLAWLAFAAGVTTSLNLGTATLLAPLRNPVLLAKEAASLDRLSGGRLRLGVGIGWLREEAETLGVEWRTRAARAESTIHALRRLWADSPASYVDDFTAFSDIHVRPGPHADSVPILITGSSPAAARRAGRIGDGFMPLDAPNLAELVSIMRSAAEEVGRDPENVEISMLAREPALAEKGVLDRMANLGVSRIIVRFPTFDLDGIDNNISGIDRILDRLTGLTLDGDHRNQDGVTT